MAPGSGAATSIEAQAGCYGSPSTAKLTGGRDLV
jgi:hypothetical protein